MNNSRFIKAQVDKKDEYYTLPDDIIAEIQHYKDYLKDKAIICPCDDPSLSAFYKVLKGIECKRVIAVGINSFIRIYEDGKEIDRPLQGNGDFRSSEVQELIKQADIVITNPPYSLLREFMLMLLEMKKEFLILGSLSLCSLKEIAQYLIRGEIKTGYNTNKTLYFIVPDSYKYDRVDKDGNKLALGPAISWWHNLPLDHNRKWLRTGVKYDPLLHPTYTNYPSIIHCPTCSLIPDDYNGEMSAPYTFISKINLNQYEIVGLLGSYDKEDRDKGIICGERVPSISKSGKVTFRRGAVLGERALFTRLVIKRKKL